MTTCSNPTTIPFAATTHHPLPATHNPSSLFSANEPIFHKCTSSPATHYPLPITHHPLPMTSPKTVTAKRPAPGGAAAGPAITWAGRSVSPGRLARLRSVSPRSGEASKQLAANRRNAQRSTGSRTPDGKARSRWNALKHSPNPLSLPSPAARPLTVLGEEGAQAQGRRRR